MAAGLAILRSEADLLNSEAATLTVSKRLYTNYNKYEE